MENKINPQVRHFFSNEENLINLLANASYPSFFHYGALKGTYDKYITQKERLQNLCREDKWAKVLLRGGCIAIYDIEEDEQHLVDFNMILKGATIVQEQYPKSMARMFVGEDDFFDNDAIIQCAIFGEIIYG